MLLHTFLLFYSLLSPDRLVVWMCRMLHWCKGGPEVRPCTSEVVMLESLSICLRLGELKSSNLSVVFCSIHSKQRENPKSCCAIGADLPGSSAHLLATPLSLLLGPSDASCRGSVLLRTLHCVRHVMTSVHI